MARADRLERLDGLREEMEAQYRETLIAALRKAASGSWGLFNHNQDRSARANWKATVDDLFERGQEINEMRETLSLGTFELHREFETSRGPVASNAPGEPKQAQAWLDRLAPPA